MLTVKDLTVAYADTPVFADVAVHFNAGKISTHRCVSVGNISKHRCVSVGNGVC